MPRRRQSRTDEGVPLHFMTTYCLRCGTRFRPGHEYPLVRGGPEAKYQTVGLAIDEACLQPPELDVIAGAIRWCEASENWQAGIGRWPYYLGSPPGTPGFAKVSMLDNGVALVGRHRNHVEVWRESEVHQGGGRLGSYAEGYGLYLNRLGLYHSVIEVRFYDLTTPLSPTQALTPDANRFLPGRRAPDPAPDR